MIGDDSTGAAEAIGGAGLLLVPLAILVTVVALGFSFNRMAPRVAESSGAVLGEFLLSWVVTPAVMLAVLTGLGLLVWRSGGGTLPGVYVLPLGFAAAVLVASFVTQLDATAELTPVAFAAGAGGIRRGPARAAELAPTKPERLWPLLAAAVPFGVMAAPVVLSTASFTGYARIVDIAHQLQIGAHLASEGRAIPLVDSSAERSWGRRSVGYPGGWQSALASFEPLGPMQLDVPALPRDHRRGDRAGRVRAAGACPRGRAARPGQGAIAAQGNVLFAYGGTRGCKELAAASHRARGRPGLRAPHRGGAVARARADRGGARRLLLRAQPGGGPLAGRAGRGVRSAAGGAPAPRRRLRLSCARRRRPWQLQRSRSPP